MSAFLPRILHCTIAVALAAACAPAAYAQQEYPARPVKIVVAFPPGGAPDLVSRVLGQKLSERLGQQFVTENRPGAGGNIAMENVARATADGYTLLLASDAPFAINPYVYAKLPYDPVRDFAPIAIATRVGFVLLACPNLPVSSVAELAALAKSKLLNFASSGFGSNHHILGEMLKRAIGADLTHVPYKGFGQGVADAIGCKVDLIFGGISSALPHVRAGKLKALAVTIPARHPNMPSVPTMTEVGHAGVEMDAWFGIAAPAATPRAVIDKLHRELFAILREKAVIDRFTGAGLDMVVGVGPEQFASRIQADLAKYGAMAKSFGAKVQ